MYPDFIEAQEFEKNRIFLELKTNLPVVVKMFSLSSASFQRFVAFLTIFKISGDPEYLI